MFLTEPLESRRLLSISWPPFYEFDGNAGKEPSSLVQDAAGDFFGVTYNDNTDEGSNIFELPVNSTIPNIILHFPGGDSEGPNNLLIDTNGNLFGIAEFAGTSSDTIFEIPHGQTSPVTLVSDEQTQISQIGRASCRESV